MKTIAQLSPGLLKRYIVFVKLGLILQFRYTDSPERQWRDWVGKPDQITTWLANDFDQPTKQRTCIRRRRS